MQLNHLEEEIYGRADHSPLESSLSGTCVTSKDQGEEASAAENNKVFANRNHEDEICGGAHNLEV